MQLVDKLIYYMQYPFVKYALVVGILIALCSSLFGATLVLKRFSFIGDGLSHVAFGAMAVGSVLKLTNNTIIVMPVTVAAAILILMSGQNAKLKGDAAIAMMSVGALAVGYLIMNVFSTSANVSGDVCSTLFGSTSILTLTMGEVWLCIVMSICVIAFFCLFYNRIFAVTFDESFTRAIGKNAGAYNLALAVIIAVIMLMCGKVTHKNLIDSSPLFRKNIISKPSRASQRQVNGLSPTVDSPVCPCWWIIKGRQQKVLPPFPIIKERERLHD